MTRPCGIRLAGGFLALGAYLLLPAPAQSAPAEVKLDKDFLTGVVEKLPPFPFQKEGKYRGTVQTCRLLMIEPHARRFLVACQVAGEFRPPVSGPLSDRVVSAGRERSDTTDPHWRKFRFEIRAGIRIEPGADGTPRFRVAVDEVKRQELEGVAGTLAKFLGRYFDEIVTRVAAGKVALLSERLNAQVLKRVALFKEYGVFCDIDYAADHVVLKFDVTRLKSEGVAGYVFAAPQPGTTPFRRWVHRRLGFHVYTAGNAVLDPAHFLGEGTTCHVFDHALAETVPLYTWSNRRDFLYTTSTDTGDVSRAGYRLLGVVCHLYPSAKLGTIPLYRFVDPRTGRHFYTTHPHAEFAK